MLCIQNIITRKVIGTAVLNLPSDEELTITLLKKQESFNLIMIAWDTQVLNPATKLYILRRGTTQLSQWTKFHSCRIKICIYRNLSTNLLPYIRGAFNSCNIK